MKKKFLIILSAVLFSFSLVSCGKEQSEPVDDFLEYHFDSNNRVFTTSRGTEMVINYMEKEEDAYEPRVVFSLWVGNTEPDRKMYDWCQLSIEERKADLRECGDMVIEYAKDKGWNNNYYLYVAVETISSIDSIVYDYEDESLHIPNDEQIYCAMYEQFGTMSKKDLEEMEGGIDFLVANDMAYIKHGEVEYEVDISGGVSVYDGEFSVSLDEDDYTIY